MEQVLISKSGKKRQGHTYTIDRDGNPVTRLDKYPRLWKQVVFKEEANYRKTNGERALISKTRHVPI